MRKKYLIFIIISTFMFSCNRHPYAGISNEDKNQSKQAAIDYVFYRSLCYAYNQKEGFKNDVSPSFYADLGNLFEPKIREYLDSIAKLRAVEATRPINPNANWKIVIYGNNPKLRTVFVNLLEDYKDKKKTKEILIGIDSLKGK